MDSPAMASTSYPLRGPLARPAWRARPQRQAPLVVVAAGYNGAKPGPVGGSSKPAPKSGAPGPRRKVPRGRSWLWTMRKLQSGAEQRWAAAKASVPLLAAVAAFFAGVANKLREIKMDYYDFCGEETKRKWRWEKRYQEESKIWFGIMVNVWLFCLTCIYQIVIPINLLLAVVPPLIVAILYSSRPWATGIAVALYIMLPIKFLPLTRWGILPALA